MVVARFVHRRVADLVQVVNRFPADGGDACTGILALSLPLAAFFERKGQELGRAERRAGKVGKSGARDVSNSFE